MALGPEEELKEIFPLLGEQQQLLQQWPYSAEQLEKDRKISVRIRELFDRMHGDQALPDSSRTPPILRHFA